MDMGAGLFLHSGLVSAALLMDDVPVFICICTFLIAGNLFHSGLIPTILIVDMVAGPALHGFYIAAVRRVRRVVLTEPAGIGSGLRRRDARRQRRHQQADAQQRRQPPSLLPGSLQNSLSHILYLPSSPLHVTAAHSYRLQSGARSRLVQVS